MRKHVANIINIKRQEPQLSIVDIITEYSGETPDFDVEELAKFLRKRENAGIKEFFKKDMVEFKFAKSEESIFNQLF